MLTARTRRTEGINFKVGGVYLQLYILRLGQNRHCNGRGVYAPLRFGIGHTLNAVHAAFVFKA